MFSPDELAQVAALCAAHDLLAVTDEVYEHLVFDGSHVPLATLPGMRDRTVTISSGGKTFSFTGWKVGWVCAARAAGRRRAGGQAIPDLHQPRALPAGHRPRPGVRAARARGASRPSWPPSATCSATGWPRWATTVYRPAATYFATTDIAPVAPGLSAQEFCLALPERCGVVAIPSSVFYDPADPAAGPDAGALGLLQARRRAARRAGPLSIVGTMSIPITWVDAFSDAAFGGNPAAVCLLDEPLDDARMQSIAFELGIAETAYPHAHRRPDDLRPALVLARHRDRPVRPRHPGLGPRPARGRHRRRHGAA